MIEYVCFDPDCPFHTENRYTYAIHLYDVHTRPDLSPWARDDAVEQIMDQQGYRVYVHTSQETRLPVSGGMRRRPVDYDDKKRDIW